MQQYSTLSLSDTYSAIAYYLRHQKDIETYLQQREQIAVKVQQRFQELQPDLSLMRSRLLARRNNQEA